jgi:2-aminoadipate transaminase
VSFERFFSHAAAGMFESEIRRMGTVAAQVPDLISFAPGHPDPSTFPWDAFREIAGDLLRSADMNVLQYGSTRGYRPLLESLDEVLRDRGIVSKLDERIITTGSQQALDLVARVLLDPGDAILVELPTYTGAITAFSNAQAVLAGVAQDADGVNLDALDEALARQTASGRRVKFLYVVPNFQNPTGLLIGLEKRRRLIEWAARRDLLIVEDDPYGALYFPDTATPEETRPVKADDADGRVLYLGSFSKTLAPGFRVGWIVASREIVAKVELAKQAADLCSGALDQRLVHRALAGGLLGDRVDHLRMFYQDKRSVMRDAIARDLGGVLRAQPPRGGFFLWGTLPAGLDAGRLLTRALQERVNYVSGRAFFVDGTGAETLRLCFSQATHEQITEGVKRLARAIKAESEAYGVGTSGAGAAAAAGGTSAVSGISVPSG